MDGESSKRKENEKVKRKVEGSILRKWSVKIVRET